MTIRRPLAAFALAGILAITACGSDDDPAPAPIDTGLHTIRAAGGAEDVQSSPTSWTAKYPSLSMDSLAQQQGNLMKPADTIDGLTLKSSQRKETSHEWCWHSETSPGEFDVLTVIASEDKTGGSMLLISSGHDSSGC